MLAFISGLLEQAISSSIEALNQEKRPRKYILQAAKILIETMLQP